MNTADGWLDRLSVSGYYGVSDEPFMKENNAGMTSFSDPLRFDGNEAAVLYGIGDTAPPPTLPP